MDAKLKQMLLSLARRDLETRDALAADGTLFEGYHPKMRLVHEENAATLSSIVSEHGWPSRALVGEDAAEAAWLIAQHAIALPDFQRRCLEALETAASNGEVPAWQPAMLLDRIRVLEGKPQVYGTNFDWSDDGQMSPRPIEEPEGVDERRARVGLPPLATAVARQREQTASQPRPTDVEERRRQMDQWAREVGWR